MSCVYVVRYKLNYETTELVSVYSTLRGALNRLEIMDLHNSFDEDEMSPLNVKSYQWRRIT